MPDRTPPVRRRAARRLAAAPALLLALLVLLAGPAVADVPHAGAADGRPTPPLGAPWFGPALNWSGDGVAAYADRLGATPALYAQTLRYPLGDRERTLLRQYVDQLGGTGALALLSLEPRTALTALTEADAAELAEVLAELGEDGIRFLLRFAPEMNGSWTAWGQQPDAYVDAFRTVAGVVHAQAPDVAMVWSPAYGAGYPYGSARGVVRGSGPRDPVELDTDGNGTVGPGDDPYAPYWPGADAVDWVGLSLHWFGPLDDLGANDVPPPGTFADQLAGVHGYGAEAPAGRDFYGRYAEGAGKPVLLETGALYVPSGAGAGADAERAVKRSWWRQVLDPAVQEEFPGVGAVVWRELSRPEAEADDALVDWRVTADAELAGAFARDLAASELTINGAQEGELRAGGAALAQVREVDAGRGDQMGWIVACAAALLLVLGIAAAASRARPQWRYADDPAGRDLRLDALRGVAIVAVVLTHVEVAGAFEYVTRNALGAISGAEALVLLSGLALGAAYPATLRQLGRAGAAAGMLRRAGRLYRTALVLVVAIYVLSLLPGVDGTVLTTFVDRGTGAAGEGAQGRVYDLYATTGQLFAHPPPWYAVEDLLTLQVGPWVSAVLGLFVVLTLLVPLVAEMLRRGLGWLALLVSWALYVLEAVTDVRLFAAQFEDAFPLLAWQVVFVHGLVVGWHRTAVLRALRRPGARLLLGAAMGCYVLALVLLWTSHTLGAEIPLVPSGLYEQLYPTLYQRTDLQVGRLLDLVLVLVAGFALLTACWRPVHRLTGWFFVPLGRSSLAVLVVHVFLVLTVGNLPGLDRSDPVLGTLVHAAVLAAVWLLVRNRAGGGSASRPVLDAPDLPAGSSSAERGVRRPRGERPPDVDGSGPALPAAVAAAVTPRSST